MTGPLVALCGVLGLIVGSFLNVVIWRVPRGESVASPPSHCPRCDAPIKPYDNVPVVSWLVLRGTCRRCGLPISARYPAVELLTGVLFAGTGLRFADAPRLVPAYLYLMAVCVALALIDLDTKRLPDVLTLPSYAVGGVLLGAAALVGHEPRAFIRALIGMAALYGFYFALVLVYPKGMGFGDVKLAGVLGLYLAYLDWGAWTVGWLGGIFAGGVLGIALLGLGYGRKFKLPYGPFLIVGALAGVFWGPAIARAYLRATGVG